MFWDCNRFLPSLEERQQQQQQQQQQQHQQHQEEEAVVIVNSQLPRHFARFWERASIRLCADGGANRLFEFWHNNPEQRKKFLPQAIVGDLDSILPDVRSFYSKLGCSIVHIKEQDSTDLSKCLNYIDEQKDVLILGGMGGNFTQELSNLNALYENKPRRIVLLSDENVLFLLKPGKHVIACQPLTKVGLIPLGERCEEATTTGLKWNLKRQALQFGGLVSSSNEMVENRATIEVSHPLLWTCDFRK